MKLLDLNKSDKVNEFSYRLVCKKFIRNGTTGDSSGLAFVTCFMSYVLKYN